MEAKTNLTIGDFFEAAHAFCRHHKTEAINVASLPDIMPKEEIQKNETLVKALQVTFTGLVDMLSLTQNIIEEMGNEDRHSDNGDPAS